MPSTDAPHWDPDNDLRLDSSADDDDQVDDYDGLRRTRDDSAASDMLQLDAVADALAADDGLDQAVVNSSLDPSDAARAQRKFEDLPFRRVTLTELKNIYDSRNVKKALNLLRTRCEISLDPDTIYETNDPSLAWDIPNHFLDFLLVVSDNVGFDAILPNVPNDPHFVFNLDLHQPARTFKSKHANVGFSLDRSMLYIGKSRGKDNVWLAMAPNQFFSGDASYLEPHPNNGPTILAPKHYWMLVMFLAHLIDESLPGNGIYCAEKYPDIHSTPRHNVEASTNLLDNPAFELFHGNLSTLHAAVVNTWDQWVLEAPDSWKKDAFITTRRPISVVCRYGQNQPIANPTTITLDKRYWHDERNYRKIRLLTVAIASHLSVKKVNQWQDIPSADIVTSTNGPIYDSAYIGDREEIQLNAFDLLDNAGAELPIYNKEGFRIPRRIPLFAPNRLPCGLLVALDRAPELFSSPGFESDFEEDGHQATKIWMYPQAFTKTHGHLQANDVPRKFKEAVVDINNAVATRIAKAPDSDDDSDDDEDNGSDLDQSNLSATAVFCVAFQIYNSFIHQVRTSASDHDAQMGTVGNALSGSHATGAPQKRTAQRMKAACEKKLPHQRFEQRSNQEKVPTDLRLEVVTTIDVRKLQSGCRSGSRIYTKIIADLARIWTRPPVLDPLKGCLTILRPSSYPDMYPWATQGITLLIQKLWDHCRRLLDQGKRVPAPYVEITSVLERTHNYAHTGNARVIATSLMNPLFVGMALIKHGMPTFSDILKWDETSMDIPFISDKNWPRHALTKQPRFASKRAQILTYGNNHWETYHAMFSMTIAAVSLPAHVFPGHSAINRYCLVITDIAVKRFIADTKSLVKHGIYEETQDGVNSDDPAIKDAAKARRSHVDDWMTKDFPLGYEEDAYLNLLRALRKPDQPMSLLLGNEQAITTLELATMVYNMAKPVDPKQRQPPISNTGSFLAVLKVAIKLMTERLKDSGVTLSPDKHIVKILAVIFDNHKIQHVPWSTPAVAGASGRPSRKVVYTHWRSTAKSVESGETAIIQVLDLHERQDLEVRNVVKQAEISSPTTGWNAIELNVSEFPKYLHKQRLPDDCHCDYATLDSANDYVRQTYKWVIDRYNSKKPIHHLALIVAFMLTKKVPALAHGPLPTNIASCGRRSDIITGAVRAEPWITTTSTRKGSTDPYPFLVMTFVYIVAMMEPESPLRRYVANDAQHGLGQSWTKKHGHKYINPFNMVRMGLADAHSIAIYRSPKYGPNNAWTMKSVSELTNLYHRLIATFGEKPYGPFNVASSIVGRASALLMADPNSSIGVQFPAPPTYQAPRATTSSEANKRPMGDDLESDNFHLYPVQKKIRKH